MKYAVIVETIRNGTITTKAVGPFISFKAAEDHAKAWDKTDGRTTHVLPLVSVNAYALSEVKQ